MGKKGYLSLALISLIFSMQSVFASIQFDQNLNPKIKKLVIGDVSRIANMGLTNLDSNSLFSQTFGTNPNKNSFQYLMKRIHFILPPDANYKSYFNVNTQKTTNNMSEMASNVSLNLFLTQLMSLPAKIEFLFNGIPYPINNTRIGAVRIGTAYLKENTPQIARVSALMHEARHSDCIQNITKKDIEILKTEKKLKNINCGFAHSVCPSGHPYAGFEACDRNAWGSYSIESVYMGALLDEKTCPNCSEAERSVARMILLDNLSRVLNWKDLNSGAYGPPKMN